MMHHNASARSAVCVDVSMHRPCALLLFKRQLFNKIQMVGKSGILFAAAAHQQSLSINSSTAFIFLSSLWRISHTCYYYITRSSSQSVRRFVQCAAAMMSRAAVKNLVPIKV
jgi:hypothetical protein